MGALILFGPVLLPGRPSAAAAGRRDDLLAIARNKIREKDYSSAEELIRKVLIKESTSSKAYNLLGVCQTGTGKYEAARVSFEKAIELNPKYASARVNLGILLLGLHEDAAALKQFKAALADDPSILSRDPTSYLSSNILGLCLMDEKKYEAALAAFQRSVRINPAYLPARLNMGNALVALKRDGAALKEFLAALKIDPENSAALYNVGLIYGRQGKFDAASKYLGQAHRLAPRLQAVTLSLIGADLSSGKKQEAESLTDDWEKSGSLSSEARKDVALLWMAHGAPGSAVKLVQGYPALSSELCKIGYEKAESEFQNGHYQEAARELKAIQSLQPPDAAFHNLLGSIYYALDDPRRASNEFQDAIKLQPDNPDLYFKLGMVFLKHLTPSPAIYVFKTGLKIRPDAPKLWLGLGLSYFIAYRSEDAERALRKAIALNPRYEIAYVVLGDVVAQSGRASAALEEFSKAIAISPDSPVPYYYYGKLAQEYHPRDAVEKLRKAVALKPSFAEAHYELGKALAKEGNTAEAIAELQRSLQLNPGLAQSHYQLALIYGKLGDHSESAEQLRQFARASKQKQPEDLIQGLEVQIEKP